jgi:uncharacterized protein (DUF58 family)
MVVKILGVISMVVGAAFVLLAILVLLPFLGNFNMSLLVLVALFGLLAWVFLAIGWQLFHPPEPKLPPLVVEPPALEEADDAAPAVGVSAAFGAEATQGAGLLQTDMDAPTFVAALTETEIGAGDADALDFSWVTPAPRRGRTFVGLEEAHTDLENVSPPEQAVAPAGDDGTLLHRHGYFRKPGAPVPSERTKE